MDYNRTTTIGWQTPPVSAKPDSDQILFMRLEDLMRNEQLYLKKGLTLENIAVRFGIHRNQLSRAVNRFSGSNFAHYLASYRLTELERIALEKGSTRIADLAYEAGFSNRVAFYRAVKVLKDKTPSQFLRETVARK